MTLSDYVVMITPKAVLNTPEFRKTRDLLATKKLIVYRTMGKWFQGSAGRNNLPICWYKRKAK